MTYLLPTQILPNNIKEKKYLIAGKWCLNSFLKKKIDLNNSKILNYHWDNREKFEKDYSYIKELNNSAIDFLAKNLNDLHNVKFTKNYWYKALGFWLIHFSGAFFDRYSTLKNANTQSNNLVLETFDNFDEKNLAKNDTSDFVSSLRTDDYNLELFTEVSKSFENIDIKYNIKRKNQVIKSKFNYTLKQRLINYFFKFIPRKFKKVITVNSQISLLNSVQLTFLTRNVFLPISFPKSPKIDVFNKSMRNWNIEELKLENEFEKIFFKSLPKFLPRIFLEGFKKSVKIKDSFENKVNLNKNPSLIFTCNAHFRDDIFKLWMAEKCDSGSKFISYQHGCGCKGKLDQLEVFENQISQFRFRPSIKMESTDKKYLNVGRYNFRLKFRKKFLSKSKVLIGLYDVPRYSNYILDRHISSQFLYYLDDQINFYKELNKKIKKKTEVRLYPKATHWETKQKFQNNFPNVKFDKSETFLKSLNKTSLFIGTYNATTYNETLLANIPTILFWDEKFSKVSDYDSKNFDLLKDVGIFHNDPFEAAKYVNKIYDNLEEWWSDELLQKNVKIFCQNYSGNSEKIFVDKFKILINKEL